MEDVVQLVEYHIVAVRVMGSNPIILPKNNKWRVGRVDDCGGLENRWPVTGPGGSNPSPSAGSVKILGAQGQVVQHTCSR